MWLDYFYRFVYFKKFNYFYAKKKIQITMCYVTEYYRFINQDVWLINKIYKKV